MLGDVLVTRPAKTKVPPSTPSHVNRILWLVWATLVTLYLVLTSGCATGNFSHLRAKGPDELRVQRARAQRVYEQRRIWSGPCYEARVKRAKGILLYGEGRPWVALYFMRCTPKSDWVGTLVPRRARRKMR
jgi:hypothetical protein